MLHKTIDVLEALREQPSGLSLATLAARLKIPKATVFRILSTLESRSYLDRTGTGEYRLGRKLVRLDAELPGEQAIACAARPAMQALLDVCKETVNLGVLDGGEVLVVETMESPQAVRMSSKIGNRRYAHSTALGKVLLAGRSEKEVSRITKARGMPAFTRNTITSARVLAVQLEKVRQQGWAIDNRENEEDGRCIAAPVFGPGGVVVAAVSVSGPVPRMTTARARSLIPALLRAAADISGALGGCRPPATPAG